LTAAVIVQFAGQTPLNLALGLQKNGANIIGTTPQRIEIAEDCKLFAAMLGQVVVALGFRRRKGTPTCSTGSQSARRRYSIAFAS